MLPLWLISVGTFPRSSNLSIKYKSSRFRGRARKKAATSFCYANVNNSNKKEPHMAKKRQRNQSNESFANHNHFDLHHVKPLTVNQSKVFDAYNKGFNLVCHGFAGTGKTYLSLYLALNDVLNHNTHQAVTIIRSVVPSRDMGFLPGSAAQKAEVYEKPYQAICDDLFGRGDGYKLLKLRKLIEFETTSFLRGVTLNNRIIVVDEINNLTFQELDTVMTRVGDNSRIIFCGDYRQTDLNRRYDKTGIREFMDITRRLRSFEHVEFEEADIVRAGVVKDYIITRTEMGF